MQKISILTSIKLGCSFILELYIKYIYYISSLKFRYIMVY